MKRILQGMMVAVAVFSFVSLGFAGNIKGTLEKIDEQGSFYHIKDRAGKEHRVHFDGTTKKTGDIKAGAMVEVDEERGHATSIKVKEKEMKDKEMKDMDHRKEMGY